MTLLHYAKGSQSCTAIKQALLFFEQEVCMMTDQQHLQFHSIIIQLLSVKSILLQVYTQVTYCTTEQAPCSIVL